MLAEGRTNREVHEIAARVYGPPADKFVRQYNYFRTLGVLKNRAWGDNSRADEIRRVAREVVLGVPR